MPELILLELYGRSAFACTFYANSHKPKQVITTTSSIAIFKYRTHLTNIDLHLISAMLVCKNHLDKLLLVYLPHRVPRNTIHHLQHLRDLILS